MVQSLFNNSICVSISLKRITFHITASLKKYSYSHTRAHITCLFCIVKLSVCRASNKDTFATTIFAIHEVETLLPHILCGCEKCRDFNELFEILFFLSTSPMNWQTLHTHLCDEEMPLHSYHHPFYIECQHRVRRSFIHRKPTKIN